METKKLDNLLEDHKLLLTKLKELAFNSFLRDRYDFSINSIRAFATVAANINFIYTDENLESLLGEVALKLVENNVGFNSEGFANRIVFYDGFGRTNVPLTLQYIRALKKSGVEILYIYEDLKGRSDSEIENELSTASQITVFKLSSSLSPSNKILKAFDVIARFNPSKALLHLGEVHVEAVAVFSLFPKMVKYRINLGDHHFWFGANQLDFCLEFRGYGAEISIKKRGIPLNKILYQPYYPIIDDRPFEGFPFYKDAADIVVFSGGRLFKIFGRDHEYFSIVKRILEENPNVKFVLAGKNGGYANYISKFIKQNGFENRFYYIGHRRDVNEVFKRCDLYLNTYPQSGSLMCLYAAVNNKPILTYTTEDLPENRTEDLLYNYISVHCVSYYQKDLFFSHVSKLVNNQEYRFLIGKEMAKFVISRSEFDLLLIDNLQSSNAFCFEDIVIDYAAFVKLSLEMEYSFYNMTAHALLKNYSWKVFFYFPRNTIKVLDYIFTWVFLKMRFSI